MKITKKWLQEKSACSEGVTWFLAQKETQDLPVLRSLIDADKLQWANWLICRLMDKSNCVRYAIFAAQQVLSIYEKRHPKDKRPRKAIEAAQAWLDNPTDKTRAAAYAAADAAYAADAYAAAAAYAADAYAAAAYAAAAYAADAYAADAYAADAAAAARSKTLKACADIVRAHYPVAPALAPEVTR